MHSAFEFRGYMSRSVIVGSYGSLTYNILRNINIVLSKDQSILPLSVNYISFSLVSYFLCIQPFP